MHSCQLGEHSIHERFSPRADQLSEIEQAIDGHRHRQGRFSCARYPLFEQKDRVGRGDVPLHAVIVDRLRWWQTEPSAGAKTTARRPRGRAGVGAGALRCGVGGINTAATVRATRSRSNNAHRQGGYGDGGGRSFDDLDRCLQVVAFVLMAIFS